MEKYPVEPLPGTGHFQWIFENAPVAIALLNAEEVWLEANPAMCSMLLMRKEDLIGTKYQAFTPDEALAERDRARAEFERTGSLRGKFILYRSVEDKLHIDILATMLPGGERLVMATDITDHERSKVELRHVQERLEVALAAGDVATWVWDVKKDQVYTDRNLAIWYNIDPTRPASRLEQFMMAIHEDDRERVKKWIADAVASGSQDFESEYRVTGSDNVTRCVLARGTVERNEAGEVVRIPGVALDISDRKKAEEALKLSEHQFQTLFSVIDEGYCLCEIILDEEGKPVDYRFLEVNPLFEKQTGLKDAVGRTAYSLVPDLEPKWLETYAEVALEGKAQRFSMGSNAMGKWFDVFATPMKPLGTFALVFKDITQDREQAVNLRSSEERKAAILGSAIDCIITMDHQGNIVEFNPAAEKNFGYKAADVIGQNLADTIIPERLREAHWKGFERYINTGEARVLNQLIELPAMRADGSEFPAEVSINSIRSTNGPPFFTAFLRDITERKKTEEALREADRRKDEFIATMAHELRNPLAPIRTALDVLQMEGVGEQLAGEMTLMMDRQLRHMVHLVEDLLDVSRISQGKIELRKQLIDLSSVIHEAVEANQPACSGFKNLIHLELPPVSFVLYADRTRLIQIIGNLVNNACKFSSESDMITISLDKDGPWAMIRVRDRGIGIDPSRLPEIFKMFAQVQSPLERAHGGLGIGLSLVKNLVELHGGNVEARSDGIGKGSEFMIRLPLIEQKKDMLSEDKNRSARPVRQPRKILIADDNSDTLQSLRALLTMHGHQVHTASDGVEAVEKAITENPEVIILDIGMPRSNGYDAAGSIREQLSAQKPVLAALTGWGQTHDRERARAAGFDHHMVKPVDPALLLSWLDQLPLR